MKKLLLIFAFMTVSLCSTPQKEQFMLNNKISENYLNFLDTFCTKNNDIISEMHQIFTTNLVKIVNGKTVGSNLQEVHDQMQMAKNNFGNWHVSKVYHNNTITNSENNMCIAQFEVTAKDFGTLIVIAYFKYDKNGLIYEINEVDHKK